MTKLSTISKTSTKQVKTEALSVLNELFRDHVLTNYQYVLFYKAIKEDDPINWDHVTKRTSNFY